MKLKSVACSLGMLSLAAFGLAVPVVAQEPVKIGFITTLSGPGGYLGQDIRDAFQLASDKVTILHPVKMGEIARIGPAQVRERYDVEPAQVPDFIALRGDPSDKIPGARGVGEKTAASLLKRYPDLEAMLDDGKFEAQADDLRLYRRLATMVTNAPLQAIPDMAPTWDRAAALARDWELKALSERLEQLAAG